jgi:hypothetical protein
MNDALDNFKKWFDRTTPLLRNQVLIQFAYVTLTLRISSTNTHNHHSHLINEMVQFYVNLILFQCVLVLMTPQMQSTSTRYMAVVRRTNNVDWASMILLPKYASV